MGDGIQWTRPDAGQVPWPTAQSTRDNNIVIDAGGADPNRGIYLDPHETNASMRYKAFGSFASFNGVSIRKSRLGIVTSADGIAWAGS